MGFVPSKKKLVKEAVLLSLLEGAKNLSALTKDIDIVDTTVLHDLKQLTRSKLVSKLDGVYSLTSLGLIEAQIYKSYYLSSSIAEAYQDFWLNHDITGIPTNLMVNLWSIADSTVIKSTPTNIGHVYTYFLSVLRSAKSIWGVSPIFHPDFVVAFREILDNGVKIQLVATHDVLKIFQEVGPDVLLKHVPSGNLQLFLNDNLKIALTVTDKCFSLGLFDLNGDYDSNSDLVGEGEEAIDWAYQLFESALKQSVPYDYLTPKGE